MNHQAELARLHELARPRFWYWKEEFDEAYGILEDLEATQEEVRSLRERLRTEERDAVDLKYELEDRIGALEWKLCKPEDMGTRRE